MLDLIGTFILRCKLAKTAKLAKNGLEDLKKGKSSTFKKRKNKPQNNFEVQLSIAYV